MRLAASEFIRRFLSHVLPSEFVRIRHYGILANGRRKEKLARCRELLATPEVKGVSAEQQATLDEDSGNEAEWCERCGVGRMQRREELPLKCDLPPGIGDRSVSITHRARASPAL